MKLKAQELFSIPNLLSFLRILLIPLFVIRYVTAQTASDYYVAAAIILFSGFTDLIDGKIARKFHMVTDLGKALDPVADKLTQAGIVLSLMFKIQWMYLLVLLFIVKEAFMGISCLVIMRKGKKLNGAMWFGKVCTAVLYVAMFILIAVPGMPSLWQNLLMLICAAFMLLSMCLYIPVFRKLYQENE